MAASLETRIQTNRKTTKKQTEKQRNKQKQRYQKTRTCMAASLETPPAGALRAGDSPALGGSAADIIFTSFFLLFLLLYYSSFSSLFFFFILGLNHLKFLLTNLIVFIAITTFGAASSLFWPLPLVHFGAPHCGSSLPLTWHLRLINSLQYSAVSKYFISWIFKYLLSPQFT